MSLSTFFEYAFDLLTPPRRTEKIVRTLSLATLCALAPPPRELLGDTTAISILPYKDPAVAALVWEVKYYANKRAAKLAGALFAEVFLDIASEEVGHIVLIPIPMHHKRKKERGHNQTELLCKAALAHLSGRGSFDYKPDILERTLYTTAQQGLPKHRRLRNVTNSMKLKGGVKKDGGNLKNSLKDRVCIIVDDVSTTGATFAEAYRALKESGARRIYCVALAGS